MDNLTLEKLKIDGTTRDYISIQYAGSDKLCMPVEKLDLVSKYIGAHADDGLVKLSKFGGGEWVRAKTRAKAAVKEMAKELIKLYAERKRLPGFAFSPDSPWQQEFEEQFEYNETEDQLKSIAEIKRDMETDRPMDRLLCGDVGYGKTEVALRAAYKAVLGGKQVAILVPTTLLALQHYQTIVSRMRAFAVNVDMLSRFRTAKQQTATLRRLARGEVDIIVGTHRLLSKDVSFKNLDDPDHKEYHLPDFRLPDGKDHYEFLRELAYEGFDKKYPERTPELIERFNSALPDNLLVIGNDDEEVTYIPAGNILYISIIPEDLL